MIFCTADLTLKSALKSLIFGNFPDSSLAHYGVDIRFLHKRPTASTALAFVFLDNDGDRSFSFYRDKTADMLFSIDQVSEEWLGDGPIFHVCGNTLTNVDIAAVTAHALQQASHANCLIGFNVNLRANLRPDGNIDRSRCDATIRSADFIKFAKEEIEILANGNEIRYIDELPAGKARLISYCLNSKLVSIVFLVLVLSGGFSWADDWFPPDIDH